MYNLLRLFILMHPGHAKYFFLHLNVIFHFVIILNMFYTTYFRITCCSNFLILLIFWITYYKNFFHKNVSTIVYEHSFPKETVFGLYFLRNEFWDACTVPLFTIFLKQVIVFGFFLQYKLCVLYNGYFKEYINAKDNRLIYC